MRLILLILLFSSHLRASLVTISPFDSIPTKEEGINLLFVGDVMGHGPQIKSAELLKNKVYDYDPCFEYVKPIIKQADLAIANLEVTLPGKAPYQGYPRFRSPDDLALALRGAGFDMLVTANNHSNDAGKIGVINTINTVQSLGFYQTGTFKNKTDRALHYPLLVYKKGYKLAFLNYTYDTNGIKTKAPTVVNEIDEELIKKDLVEAEALQPDIIIVIMHWGNEYQMKENKKQQALAKKIFTWGADLIVGAHPHVVQPIKWLPINHQDGTTKKHLIAYSLGNFISNQRQPNTDGGLMLEITLQPQMTDSSSRRLAPTRCEFIPIWRYIHKDEKGHPTYYALPAAAFENEEILPITMSKKAKAIMNKSLKTLRNHLTPHGFKERKITLAELGKEQVQVQESSTRLAPKPQGSN